MATRNLARLLSASLFIGSGCILADVELPLTCYLESGLEFRPDPAWLNLPGYAELPEELAPFQPRIELPPLVLERRFGREGLGDIPKAVDDIGATASVFLSLAEIRAAEGRFDFYAVNRLELWLERPDGSRISVLSCLRSEGCVAEDNRLAFELEPAHDLFPELRHDTLEFVLELEARFPREFEWSLDVEVCMNAQGGYEKQLF